MSLFFAGGCISESSLKPILPMQLLHSNSAKVWVLESELVNDIEKSPTTRDFKTAIILYDDGKFIEQKMVHLGSSKGNIGNYNLSISLEAKDTLFNLNYRSSQTKTFQLKDCSSTSMLLKEIELQDSIESSFWVLKTLPKPNKWY